MKGMFARVSRNSRRLSRALVALAVIMCAALALTWPPPGKAAPNCGESFTLIASVYARFPVYRLRHRTV
jgi:hypothetical protein